MPWKELLWKNNRYGIQYIGSTSLTHKELEMEASSIIRKLKELDALEKRLRQTVNPSAVLLKQIQLEREALLNPKQGELAK